MLKELLAWSLFMSILWAFLTVALIWGVKVLWKAWQARRAKKQFQDLIKNSWQLPYSRR